MGIRSALRLPLLLLGVLLTGACHEADRKLLAYGPPPTLDANAITVYASQQNTVVDAITQLAGYPSGTRLSLPEQWRGFVLAGMEYVDSQCNDYLGALDRFYRAKNTTTQQLALTGAATLGIMGVVNVAAQAIAITGLAFGLASATVDNVSKGLIYELPAATVAQLVKEMQLAYKVALPTAIADRPTAMLTLRGYIEICLPVNIETQVANAVKIAKPEVKRGTLNLPPVVQIGPIHATTFGVDENSRVLTAWLYKADKQTLVPENATALRAAMDRAGLPRTVHFSAFIASAEYAAQRAVVMKDLNL